MALLHNIGGFTSAEIEVLAELVNDSVEFLPDPEDQPEPGSFADIVIKLNNKLQISKRMYCETNYCDADS